MPEVGRIKVEMIRKAVVFPAPFGPMRPKISPEFTFKLKLSRARMLPKSLVKLAISIARFKHNHASDSCTHRASI